MKLLLSTVFIALSLSASAQPGLFLMGSLGDSITSATFADKSASDGHWEPRPDPRDTRIPFLGNSENRTTLSWTSGEKIDSHFLRLRSWLQKEQSTVEIVNASIPGNTTEQLEFQTGVLLTALDSGKYRGLKYVTLLMGANDVCAKTPTDPKVVADRFRLVFKRLAGIKQDERVRVLVSGLPNVPALGKEDILEYKTVNGLSCHTVRDRLLKFCPGLIRWETVEDYVEHTAKIEAHNKLIADLVVEATAQYPTLDLYFSNTFYTPEIDPLFLARDCFHPNTLGQSEIAKRLWNEQPWFK